MTTIGILTHFPGLDIYDAESYAWLSSARQRLAIQNVASTLGVSAAAIAGGMAEENTAYRNPDIPLLQPFLDKYAASDVLFDEAVIDVINAGIVDGPRGVILSGLLTVLSTQFEMAGRRTHEEFNALYESLTDADASGYVAKIRNPILLDLGPTNFKFATAIGLLRTYLDKYPTPANDPLSLHQYANAYDRLAQDLINPLSDATAKFWGLMLQKAEGWFRGKMAYEGQWDALPQEFRDALYISYANVGEKKMEELYKSSTANGRPYEPLPLLGTGAGMNHLYNARNLGAIAGLDGYGEGIASLDSFSLAALGNDPDSLAYRYVLSQLRYVALPHLDHGQYNRNGELDLYDPATGTGSLTRQWIEDRSQLLMRRVAADWSGSNVLTQPDSAATFYVDEITGRRIVVTPDGNVPASPHYIMFGNGADNNFVGASLSDRLYGGGGDDSLEGFDGNDHLEGNAGADVLRGGYGQDTLLGGADSDFLGGGDDADTLYGDIGVDVLDGGTGDDLLQGGTDADTYLFRSNEGHDTVFDVDGQGQIVIAGSSLNGASNDRYRFNSITQRAEWTAADGTVYSYRPQDVDAQGRVDLFISGGALVSGTILVRQFDLRHGGFLGLQFGREARLALTASGTVSPFATAVSADSAYAAALVEQGAAGATVYLNRAARAGDTLTIALSGAGAETISLVNGADTTPFSGGPIQVTLTEGQTQFDLALRSLEEIDADSALQLTVTYRGQDFDGSAATATTEGTVELKDLIGADAQVLTGDFIKQIDPETGYYVTDPLYGNYLSDGAAPDAQDAIMGSVDSDRIEGGGGNDNLSGRSGDDWVDGGSGDDLILGGLGADVLRGGEGADWLYGSARGMAIIGRKGKPDDSDPVAEGPELARGFAWVIYEAAPPADGVVLRPAILGADMTYVEDDAGSALDGGAGNDHLFAGSGNDAADGGAGDDYLLGQGGADRLFGSAGHDILFGDERADIPESQTLAAQHGHDFLDGGDGDDQAEGEGGNDVVYGGRGDDRLHGDSAGAHLSGQYHGHDAIYGEDGKDTLIGGGGSDLLRGGLDDDYLHGDEQGGGLDLAHHGRDTLEGEEGNDTLVGGGNDDGLYGGAGSDLLRGDDAQADLAGNAHGNDNLDGGDGNDDLAGGGAGDRLHGGSGDDVLRGDDVAERLDAAFHGNDELHGGDGHDTLLGGGAADQLHGGSGDDGLWGDGVESEVAGSAHGNDALDGGQGNDHLVGGGADDLLLGGDGDDALWGDDDEGNLARVHHGRDQLDGGAGQDYLDGGDGDDRLDGGTDDDLLYGGAGADTLDGGTGNDVLLGGDGDDRLDGGGGSDDYRGGAGNDTYVVSGGQALIEDHEGHNVLLLSGGASGLQASLIDQYLVLDGGGTTILIEGGLDAAFDGIADGYGNQTSYEFLAAQAQGQLDDPYHAQGSSRWWGTDGNDSLQGQTGGQSYIGGGGDDAISAVGGNNNFYYALGNGTDRISLGSGEPGEAGDNVIRFGEGIVEEDISLGTGSLLIRIGEDPNDAIHLENFDPDNVLGSAAIQRFEFADGTVLSYSELLQRGFDLWGTDASESIEGTNLTDRIEGGLGDDRLDGGAGNDQYRYWRGDGADTLRDLDTTGGNHDVLRMGYGITPGQVAVMRNYHDVTLVVADGGSITLLGQLDGEGRGIEQVELADGTVWTAQQLRERSIFVPPPPQVVHGTDLTDTLRDGDGNDTLDGRFGNDLLQAGEGDDQLYGAYATTQPWAGSAAGFTDDDVLHGGRGNDRLDGGFRADSDQLHGGEGDDSYVFRRGAGDDTVVESGTLGNADRILLENLTPDAVRFTRTPTDLQILIRDSGDRLTIRDFFIGDEGQVERFEFSGGTTLAVSDVRARLLVGGSEDDHLIGFSTDDVLSGGEGDDTLDGGAGADTYQYARGDGRDRIADSGTATDQDVLRFAGDVSPADVQVSRTEADLLLVIRGTLERVAVAGWFAEGPSLERVEFADGTVWTSAALTQLAATPIIATDSSDVIAGSVGDDTLSGLGGDDELHGLQGHDRLDGGAGADRLVGGEGDDRYVVAIGGGDDVIADGSAGDMDLLEAAEGLDITQIRVTRDETNLILRIGPSGERITIEGWYADEAQRISALRFADGSMLDAAALERLAATATAQDDFLVGSDGADEIDGGAGNDTIRAGAGDDLLIGGQGDDLIDGGSGNDVYRFDAGEGTDRLIDADGTDVLRFGPGIRAEDLQIFASADGGLVLQRHGSADRILFEGRVTETGILVPSQIETIEFTDGTRWSAADVGRYRTAAPTLGNDTITGSERAEILDGLGGGDRVTGGAGNDRYVFRAGYGLLTITDVDGIDNADTLILGEGIRAEDIVVRRVSTVAGSDLVLEVRETSDRIVITNYFGNAANRIERFEFADGTLWSAADIAAHQTVESGSDAGQWIDGSVRDDSIQAGAGWDSVYGHGGNDVIDGGTGADRIEGGEGNDRLSGGTSSAGDLNSECNFDLSGIDAWTDRLDGGQGDDTFLIGRDSGFDLIRDSVGNDRIVLGDGLSVENLIVSTPGGSAHAGRVRVDHGAGAFYLDAGTQIERIESADGLFVTGDQLDRYRAVTLNGTAGDDRVQGGVGPEVIDALAGNDIVQGGAGRDVIQGGLGDDTLYGDSGNDSLSDYAGNNSLLGGAGDDALNGAGYLSGGEGDDALTGSGVIDGGIGNDQLLLQGRSTVLFGRGAGQDRVLGSNSIGYWISLSKGVGAADVEILGGSFAGMTVPLTLVIRDTGERLTNIDGATGLYFADGTRWTAQYIREHAQMPLPTITEGADTVWGTDGDDSLAALGGNDSVNAGSGHDHLSGGSGNDSLSGGGGDDLLSGDAGNDVLQGGEGNDRLFGGEGNDQLRGSGGVDELDGGAGSDTLYGSSGISAFRFGRGYGTDTIRLTDAVDGTPTAAVIRLAEGISAEDVILTRFAPDSLTLRIRDTSDDLGLVGRLVDADGRPLTELSVAFADGTIWRQDTLLSVPVSGPIRYVLGDGSDNTLSGSDAADRLEGYSGHDRMEGAAGNDTLNGGTGNDRIEGNTGNDALNGGGGQDTLIGGAGNDTLNSSDGVGAGPEEDVIVYNLGDGHDTVWSSDLRDVVQLGAGIGGRDLDIATSGSTLLINLRDGSGSLRIEGGSGRLNRLRFADGSEWNLSDRPAGPVLGTVNADVITNPAGVFDARIYGQAGNDKLTGGTGIDRLYGGAGSDTLAGGEGPDILDGGAGNDRYKLNGADIIVFGFGSGIDSFEPEVVGGSTTTPAAIRFENNVSPSDIVIRRFYVSATSGSMELGLRGSTAALSFHVPIDPVTGYPVLNTAFVFGDGTVVAGAEVLRRFHRTETTGSYPTLIGLDSDDYVAGGSRDEAILSGPGDDLVLGDTGYDHLHGGAGMDRLYGGGDGDNLLGGQGDDVLDGGLDADYLEGGAGRDLYRFERGSGQDIVQVASSDGLLDTLEFGEGIRPEDIIATLPPYSSSTGQRVWLSIAGNSDRVDLRGAWQEDSENGNRLRLSAIRFADGTVWTSQDVIARLLSPTSGNDSLRGSEGNDRIGGGAGNDFIVGGAGRDGLQGGSGEDRLVGGSGSDQLAGDAGRDTLEGGAGHDHLSGGLGDDSLVGGAGSDTYRFARGDGADRISDSGFDPGDVDTLEFGEGIAWSELSRQIVDGNLILSLTGTADSVTITSFDRPEVGIERLRFADGTVVDAVAWMPRGADLVVEAGQGLRTAAAEPLFDTLVFGVGVTPSGVSTTREAADLLIQAAGDGIRFVGWFDHADAPAVLQVRFADGSLWTAGELTRHASTMIGTAGDDALRAEGGVPTTLLGLEGDDRLSGGEGDDRLAGGDGNDVLQGGMGQDILEGGAGDDVYVLDDAFDTVLEMAQGGSDTVRQESTTDVQLSGEIENYELLGNAAVSLIGNDAANRLVGNAAVNRIEGGEGDDLLDGGAGADVLVGGRGNDRYRLDNAADSVVEIAGEDIDTVETSLSHTLGALGVIENIALLGSANLNATGNQGTNLLVGNTGRNVLSGLEGDDTLDGGRGADMLVGGQGNDVFVVDDAGDQVVEQAAEGIDTVQASASIVLAAEVEHLDLTGLASVDGYGNAASNRMTGNAGDNLLDGAGGDDVLDGGGGRDTLRGGSGNDRYVFARGGEQDLLVEQGEAGIDRLVFAADIAPADLILCWSNADLVVSLRGTADRITLQGFRTNAGTIDAFDFADGTSWSAEQIVTQADAASPNQAPMLAYPVQDLVIAAGQELRLSLQEVFRDTDAGDLLGYDLRLADGASLPGWLQFDRHAATLSGTPSEGQAGTLSLRLTASDRANQLVEETFNLSVRVANDTSPIVLTPLADQRVRQDELLQFTIPGDSFQDLDIGDELHFSAVLADGTALPRWLRFDARTGSFSGTPAEDDLGTVAVAVTARDRRSRTATDVFSIVVEDTNDAPRVVQLVPDVLLFQGQPVDVTLPTGMFGDREGDAITEALSLADGRALPSWLSYDPANRRLYGTPDAASVGVTTVLMTATDAHGAAITDDFDIVVGDINDAPVLFNPVPTLVSQEGNATSVVLPRSIFEDPDRGDVLTYRLETIVAPEHARSRFLLQFGESGMSLLPQPDRWNEFRYGTPDYWDVGTWTFRLTVQDRLGLSASHEFTLQVNPADVNHAPVLAGAASPWLLPQSSWDATRGMWKWSGVLQPLYVSAMSAEFSVTIPTFTDVDGDAVRISVLPPSGSDPSDWYYDTQHRSMRFVGTGPAPRSVTFDIVAEDSEGARTFTTQTVIANHVPVAGEIPEIVVVEGQAFSFQLPAGTFTDADGDALLLSAGTLSYYNPVLRQTEYWSLFNAATQTLSGTPGDFAVGTHLLRIEARDPYYTVSGTPDGGAGTLVPTPHVDVRLTVLNAPDDPLLRQPLADIAIVEDQALGINLATAFVDVDPEDVLRYGVTLASGQPLPPWMQVNSETGYLSGVPRTDDVGQYALRVTAVDRSGRMASDVFDLSVALSNRNHAPKLVSPLADQICRPDQSFSFQVPRAAFIDVDGEALRFSAQLADGTPLPAWIHFDQATLTFSGQVPTDQRAPTEIRVVAADAANLQAQDVFSIGIREQTAPPVLQHPLPDQLAYDDREFHYTIPVDAFADADPSGPLVFSATRADGSALPAWLRFDSALRTLYGAPAASDAGLVDIRVEVTEPDGGSTWDVFCIEVQHFNHLPVAQPDQVSVAEDEAVEGRGNVLLNDSDADAGTVLRVADGGMRQGSYGSLLLTADGAFTYRLDDLSPLLQGLGAGAERTETFDYQVGDGLAVTTGQIRVTVLGSNDTPVAAQDRVTVAEDGSGLTGNVLINDMDPDLGTTLRVADAGSRSGAYGELMLEADGSYRYVLLQNVAALQSLADGQLATDRFSYRAADGVTEAEGELLVTIIGVNDAPVAADDQVQLSEDATIEADGNILANDRDADAASLLRVVAPGTYVGTYGDLVVAEDGSYRYRLDNDGALVQGLAGGQVAAESFRYQVTDGLAATEGRVLVSIAGANDAPQAVADIADTREDSALAATGNVLDNDRDVDGDPLRVAGEGVIEGTYGRLLLSADGAYRYELRNDDGAVQALAEAEFGLESFTFRITDGMVDTEAHLAVTVQGVNDAPVATADTAVVVEDQAAGISGNLLGNDSDVDTGASLRLLDAGLRGGVYGELSLNADGGYEYRLVAGSLAVQQLGAGQSASDIYGYRASDGLSESEGQLTILVQGTNDAPLLAESLADQQGRVDEPWTYRLPTDAFVDVDHGDELQFSVFLADGSTLPAWLTFDVATRTFSGQPSGEESVYEIRVTVTDAAGERASDVFRLTVEGRQLRGSGGAEELVGTGCRDVLEGGGGADWLRALGNDDVLVYSVDDWFKQGVSHRYTPGVADPDGAVQLRGRARNFDIFDGGAGDDLLQGTASAEVILLDDSASPAFRAGPRLIGIDRIETRAGDDVVNLTSRTYSYGDVLIDGGEGADVLWSNSGNDRLMGGAGGDELYGGNGDDLLDGGLDADSMEGGAGNDLYIVDQAGDRVKESHTSGADLVLASVSFTLKDHVEDLTLTGTGAIDGAGNPLDNALTGNAGANRLHGGSGNDTLRGGAGDDSLLGEGGNDLYCFGRGDGHDLVSQGGATNADQDKLQFASDVASDQLWFLRRDNDLEISIIGTSDKVTLDGWYLDDQHHLKGIEAGDGRLLFDAQVAQLVDAMAAFAPPAPGQMQLSDDYRAALAPVLAANWS